MSTYKAVEKRSGLVFQIAHENSFNKIQAYNPDYDITYSTSVESIKESTYLDNVVSIISRSRKTCQFSDKFEDLMLIFYVETDIETDGKNKRYEIVLELEPNLFDVYVDYGYIFNRGMVSHKDIENDDGDENKEMMCHLLNTLYRQHYEITRLRLSRLIEMDPATRIHQ